MTISKCDKKRKTNFVLLVVKKNISANRMPYDIALNKILMSDDVRSDGCGNKNKCVDEGYVKYNNICNKVLDEETSNTENK